MCGLTGYADFTASGSDARDRLQVMTDAIAHRGPDAEGHWLDPAQGVALGHRRLSIIDLSDAGAQPMHSGCERFVLTYNGEIYNHLSLRKMLEDAGAAPDWRGHSDTETLLAAIVHWGLADALRRVCGMFAIALWDRQEQVLSLARDRMGEKPLYLAARGTGWMFGSELRTLVAGGLPVQIDRTALAAYLHLGHVPDHLCILEGVRKIMPGGIMHLRAGGAPCHECYDSPEALFGITPTITDRSSALKALESTLETVVEGQMLSDVPLGCFLSGGIDSSLVASIMQAGSERPVHTFSIGFEDPRFDESSHAAAVARHLGTMHTEFILREDDALALVPDLPLIYDEPFADSSQIPTTLLCRAARRHVTVALTGDGGDEIFGGYNRHIRGPALWRTIQRVPRFLRPVTGRAVDGIAALGLRHEGIARRITGQLGLPLTTLDNLPRLAKALCCARDAESFYQTFLGAGPGPESILAGIAPETSRDPRARQPDGMDLAEWLMERDTTSYLPGDILVKVDRAAMSTGLETRAPLLDTRITTLARHIPVALHVNGKQGKLLLRDLLDRHVPRDLIERPKQGFAIPLDTWLRSALKTWGDDLVADAGLVRSLGLRPDAVQSLWSRHQTRQANLGKELWALLMLLLWARHLSV